MPKKIIFSLLISAIYFTLSYAADETLTITTYYPSPYGSYHELRTQRMAIGDGLIDGTYCWPGGTCLPANQIDTNADLIVQGNVGIGTAKPHVPLSVMQTISGVTTGVEISAQHTPGVTAGGVINSQDENGTVRPLTLQLNNGYVGIGTTTPIKSLDVNGEIRATGGSVIYSCPHYQEYACGSACAGQLQINSAQCDYAKTSGSNACNGTGTLACIAVGRLVSN